MGPRLISRGEQGAGTGPVGRRAASMGPRLISRGETEDKAGTRLDVGLQWGHG